MPSPPLNTLISNTSTALVSCATLVALQACTPTSSPSELTEDQGTIDASDMAATDFGADQDVADDGSAEPEDMRSSAPDASSMIDMQDPEDANADLDASADAGANDMGDDQEPAPPAALQRWLVGDHADAMVAPLGPAFILMGGGPDVDEAFHWWKPYHAGGDVVVLRASGADGYNDYLHREIGDVDSVETLLVDTRELADSEYVAWRVERAEAIFIAGGDQSKYLSQWRDTALQGALERALQRGAAIGGTSAGCAILGGFIYAANEGTIYSDEALADPYDMRLTLEREFLTTTRLVDVITDTHFYERDRLGRLIAFVARLREDGWSQQRSVADPHRHPLRRPSRQAR